MDPAKIFEAFQIQNTFENPDEQWLTAFLAAEINMLIHTDFQKLLHILYRLDIDENQLKQRLRDKEDAGRLMAEMILEREKQKAISRDSFKNFSDQANAEKW
ncbi:hypothetical protein ACFSPU_01945 [Haoranjiania flava]|uniref:Uncharacterized protein n=1 Tax=Haoranjiania flava TaxID=1856322 RepID=A0AAE3IKN4_9BACT|nr:hypothetical protein [Haoranjiania flava]MCU7692993.1 hypothetical protein [Haoranjiania flava]